MAGSISKHLEEDEVVSSAQTISFSILADRPEMISTIALWYFDDHGHRIAGNSFEKTCERIRGKLNRDRPPMHILAIDGGRVVGVAQWKQHEMPEYPDKENWLGSVYVPPKERGKGIAQKLALQVAETAKSFGVQEIYLCTERLDGGLYKQAGWTPYVQTISRGDNVLVMVKRLDLQ